MSKGKNIKLNNKIFYEKKWIQAKLFTGDSLVLILLNKLSVK